MTATKTEIGSGDPHSHPFQADVARLLHLVAHSIYSDRRIFLRELISNAADACEKLRYEAIQQPDLVSDGAPFAIKIDLDRIAGTLAVEDNGVGMSRDDLILALGTIANSGTRQFLERIARPAASADQTFEGGNASGTGELIGQFGIGFYSAFMVAGRVEVISRRAGSAEAWRWESDGKGEFTVAAVAPDQAPSRGTRVVLSLSDDAKSDLDSAAVESAVREHSSAISIPIFLRDGAGSAERRLTEGTAIWTKSRSQISSQEYTEVYHELSAQFDEPALVAHWRAEGRYEFTALAFVPGSKPIDLFDVARKGRARLFVRRILIDRDADVLPGWLRFVRLIVDSADLPLNLSRESVQESPLFLAIKKAVTGRLLQEFVKVSEAQPEKWLEIWRNFGPVLKEGIYEDPDRRDELYKIARFCTSEHPAGGRSLDNYVRDMRPNQTSIYYLTGSDVERLVVSPQLEGYRARNIEVLLLPDPIDAFWTATAAGFQGKPFKSVSQGSADIGSIPLREGVSAQTSDSTPQIATFIAFMKQTLESEVSDVRASDRLSSSVACLVSPDKGLDRGLERLLAERGGAGPRTKPILEVNQHHSLLSVLAKRFEEGGEKETLADVAWLVLDEARILDNEAIQDPTSFVERLTRIIARGLR